jgi:GNAT superfamily N-acetyltransferase
MTAFSHRSPTEGVPSAALQGIRLAGDQNGIVLQHLLTLDADDRRLRFGIALSDESIQHYVQELDFAKDAVLAVLLPDQTAAGIAHLARGSAFAEVGISVLPPHRARGAGSRLMELAVQQCKAWRISQLFLHYLADNAAMAAFANKHRMATTRNGSEVDAFLPIASSERTRQSREALNLLRPEAVAVVAPA